MAEKTIIRGIAFVLADAEGTLINDIDTDMIFHNRWLHITAVSEMGKYALGNLVGYEDFPKRVAELNLAGLDGFFLVAGANFGAGSSRQQAVDCLSALGCCGILATSVAPIYLRNAINAALPIAQIPKLAGKVEQGDVLALDFSAGVITNERTGEALTPNPPISSVQMEIYKAGGLLRLLRMEPA